MDRFLHTLQPRTKWRHRVNEVDSFESFSCSWIDRWCKWLRIGILESIWIFCGRRWSIQSKRPLRYLLFLFELFRDNLDQPCAWPRLLAWLDKYQKRTQRGLVGYGNLAGRSMACSSFGLSCIFIFFLRKFH